MHNYNNVKWHRGSDDDCTFAVCHIEILERNMFISNEKYHSYTICIYTILQKHVSH